jgi:gas vesicle protein
VSGSTGTTSSQPLTPEQQAMRQQAQRWNQTAVTGALAGAAMGAAGAAAFGRGNTGQNALIGAGIGALVGLAAGMLVAENNLGFEKREASASQRIEAAQQIASNLNNTAAASEQVARQNRQKLAQLDRQYRAGQISAAQYQAETETMRQDAQLMRKTAEEARDARQRLVASAREVPQLMNEEAKIDQAQRRMEAAADNLESALRRVPTG